MSNVSNFSSRIIFGIVALSMPLIAPITVQAQVLEEIVVTATRRVQTLQEVPISVGVYSGAEIDLQGYRNINDLSKYSPSVTIGNGIQEQNIAIRSFSTRGNSLTLQSAAPLFLDGIHFGRMSLVKTAFLDTERVEVLKGPQPLHFGMNATAGAFNIMSKRPTAEWEGELGTEFGNFGSKEVNAAIGGPITDTFGIRVAGIFEGSDGPTKNRYNIGESGPKFHHLGGRISSLWNPSDNFSIYSKLEKSRQRNGSQLTMGCLTGATLSGFGDEFTRDDDASLRGLFGNEQAVFANAPIGVGIPAGIVPPVRGSGTDCFGGNLAFGTGGPYLAPPANVNSSNASRVATHGSTDSRAVLAAFYSQDGNSTLPGVGGADHGGVDGTVGKDYIDTWNGLFDATYEFANGMTINSQTGYAKLDRLASRDFVISPFLLGYQPKEENYKQWSQLVRVESPTEGFTLTEGVGFDFMVQAFHQEAGLNFWNGNSDGGGLRRPMRFNNGWETSKWSAFSFNTTFRFMDDQLSISAGGRYTDVKKNVRIWGWGAADIFDEMPCDSEGTDSDPATCTVDPHFSMVDLSLTTPTFADPSRNANQRVRIDNPQLLIDGADTSNLWTLSRWGSRSVVSVPLNYRGGGVPVVGFTAPNYQNNIPAPFIETQKADNFDKQIVLSFTPNSMEGNHTFYGKYVTAFKGPVTDTGQGGLPTTFEELAFAPEYVTAFEVGAKGTLMERRLRYDIDIFRNDFKDLQTVGAAPLFNPQDQNSVSLNAGKQRVDGVEFSFDYAATERLTLNLAGSLLDGEFLEFDGSGCSANEQAAASLNILANPSGFTAADIAGANRFMGRLEPGIIAALTPLADIPPEFFITGGCQMGDTPEFAAGTSSVGAAQTVSRKGTTPQDSPSFKFVLGGNYEMPVMNSYMAFVNVKAHITDDYRTGRSSNPSVTTFFDRGGDINVSAGFGPQDGSWQLAGYVRNILQARPAYHPEFQVIPDGFITANLSDNAFTSYGIKFNYNFQ
jgi:outer membrane receptor protein involved in Fe transport